MSRKVVGAVAVLIALMWCAEVFANGIIVPPPPPPHPIPRPRRIPRPRPLPAWVKEAHVSVEINNQVARTEVQEVFANPNRWQLEGDFIFPMPADAFVKDFSFWMNGKEVKAELLDAHKARKIYTDIVRRMKDPALLEYVGTKMFRIRIFPIPAGGEARVKLIYTQLLKSDGGIVSYRYPHSTNKYSSRNLQSASVVVNIHSRKAIKNVYCPTHKVDITRKGDHHVRVGYEGSNVKPDRDFVVHYTMDDKDFGLSFLTYREKGEAGYFLALLSPRHEVAKKDVLPKDIVFVLDTSGSMSGEKIEQAKGALTYCVNSLNAPDRFNIVQFATGARKFADGLREASKENVVKARKWIAEMDARGGTNIDDALYEALSMKGSDERTFMIVFITDGLPTIGETNIEKILKNVKKRNERQCRLFVFGVGHDVNTILLDRLAEESRGARDYIAPREDIEVKISNFYDKVANPVFTDVRIKIVGLDTFDVYPKQLPDMFRGAQVAIVGRYRGEGHKAVKLFGKVGKKQKVFVYEATFPAKSDAAPYLPRTWAISKVGYLLDEMRLHGETREVRDEVVRLAKKYGILTPYTSYLVVEDEPRPVRRPVPLPAPQPRRHGRPRDGGRWGKGSLGRPGEEAGVPLPMPEAPGEAEPAEEAAREYTKAARKLEKRGKFSGAVDRLRSEPVGQSAVRRSKEAQQLQRAAQTPGSIRTGADLFGKEEEGKEIADKLDKMIKRVGPKTFYLSDGVWIDSEYKKDMKEVKVKCLSDEYFELLDKHPDAAKYFAIGSKIVVVIDDKAYRIVEE